MKVLVQIKHKDHVIFTLDRCADLFNQTCYPIKCCACDNSSVSQLTLEAGCPKYKLEKLKKNGCHLNLFRILAYLYCFLSIFLCIAFLAFVIGVKVHT